MFPRTNAKERALWLGTAALFVVIAIAFTNRHGLRTVVSQFLRHTLVLRDMRVPMAVAYGETWRSDPLFALSIGMSAVALAVWAVFGPRAPRLIFTALGISLGLEMLGIAGIALHPPTTWIEDQAFYLGRVIYGCDVLTFVCVVAAILCLGFAALKHPERVPSPPSSRMRTLVALLVCLAAMALVRLQCRPLARQHVVGPLVLIAATFGFGMRRERGAPALLAAVWLADIGAWGWGVARQCREFFPGVVAGNVLDLERVVELSNVQQRGLVVLAFDTAVTAIFIWAILRPRSANGWHLVYSLAPVVIISIVGAEVTGIARTLFAAERLSSEGLPTANEDISRLVIADRRKQSAQKLPRIALTATSTWAQARTKVPRGAFAWLIASPLRIPEPGRRGMFSSLGSDGMRAVIVEVEGSGMPLQGTALRIGEPWPILVPAFAPLFIEVDDGDSVQVITDRLVTAANAAYEAAATTAYYFTPKLVLVPRGARVLPVEPAREPPIAARRSRGCAESEKPNSSGLGARTIGGRNVVLFAPRAQTEPKALVIALHGAGGDGAEMQSVLDMERASKDDAFVAYPDGRSRIWDFTTPEAYNRDVQLLDAIVETLTAEHCIDESRIYLTGYSMGGYLAQEYACARPGKVRAIAAFSAGGPHGALVKRDEEGRPRCAPIAAMVVHGEGDDNVQPREGVYTREVRRVFAHCGPASRPLAIVPCVEYTECADPQATVAYCSVKDLGHYVWSDGAKALWNFWSHARP